MLCLRELTRAKTVLKRLRAEIAHENDGFMRDIWHQKSTVQKCMLPWNVKDTGHYWSLSKTSLLTWCISTCA